MLHIKSIFICVWWMQWKKVIYYDTQEKTRNLCQFPHMWWQIISYMNCLIARNTFHICHSLHRIKCYLMVACSWKNLTFCSHPFATNFAQSLANVKSKTFSAHKVFSWNNASLKHLWKWTNSPPSEEKQQQHLLSFML